VLSSTWERYAWAAGLLFVAALLAEVALAIGIPLNQDDSAATIARELHRHDSRSLAIACLSVVYAAAFVVYLARLHEVLRPPAQSPPALGVLVLVGGVLFVTLHGVSDIGITGMLGAKISAYSDDHDPGLAYTLYLLTFALDSVGDVFASLFAFATAALVRATGALPRWLGWVALIVGCTFLLQGFGLGGVIATFGLVVDLIGFVLLLIFVVASSVALRRPLPPT
jgi:hypothetical protein